MAQEELNNETIKTLLNMIMEYEKDILELSKRDVGYSHQYIKEAISERRKIIDSLLADIGKLKCLEIPKIVIDKETYERLKKEGVVE